MSEQKIGPILDGLGATIDLDEGDLVASALVLAKVVGEDGEVALSIVTSEGLSWIETNGLLESARQIITQTEVTRKEGDD